MAYCAIAFLSHQKFICDRFGYWGDRYTQSHGQKSFVEDELSYDAILKNIELIGEAATNIPATQYYHRRNS